MPQDNAFYDGKPNPNGKPGINASEGGRAETPTGARGIASFTIGGKANGNGGS